jgi:hypothetical protein
MNSNLGWTWKEVIATYFEIRRVTEESHQNSVRVIGRPAEIRNKIFRIQSTNADHYFATFG